MEHSMTNKIMLLVALLTTLSACAPTRQDLKSPCVGGDGSPCDRRPVNNNNVS
jgi:hypothetical protein